LVYFDLCALQRPHDDQSQLRVHVEATAVLGLLACVRSGSVGLASSDVLGYELSRTPDLVRRSHCEEILATATRYQHTIPSVERRAADLIRAGLGDLDALHLASAEAVGADYLCTCDD
jgi:predicted nucleic acid-binding protein